MNFPIILSFKKENQLLILSNSENLNKVENIGKRVQQTSVCCFPATSNKLKFVGHLKK